MRNQPMSHHDHPRHAAGRTAAVTCGVFAVLLCLAAGAASAQPTVNGWFYGDGDDALYQPYATSEYGSVLYSYYDAPNNRLYVALVVSHAVNDMACSSSRPYTSSTGWNPPRDCGRLSDSEFASFTLECAPDSPNAWSWQQGFACAQGANPPSNWVSNSSCSTSDGTWPPSLVASTSWVANVNTWQANGSPAWDLYNGTNGNNVGNWKSPFLASAPNNATAVPGYPTFSGGGYQWEWSMIYEWSVTLGAGGTGCGDEPIYFVTGISHHSPSKNSDENDDFPPPGDPEDLIFSDWGDLPDDVMMGFHYGTTSANNGPRHYLKVSGPYLGSTLQPEANGQPTTDATGDGDEEDGVTANVTGGWTVGSNQTIDVEVANAPSGALLGGWFDWNGDGDFDDAGEFVSWNVVEGTNTLSLTVGAGFDWQTDDLYARFRIFSSATAAPGGNLTQADYAGTATDGEVEDHVFPFGSLPVTVNAFASEGAPGGPVTVRWQTASETENVAFELLGLVEGEWRPLTSLVPTRRGNSALPQSYEVEIDAPAGLVALQLVDYDTRGRLERFGSFRLGESYGEVQPERRVDWSGPRAERSERLRDLGFEDTAAERAPERPGIARRAASADAADGAAGAEHWKKVRGDRAVRGLAAKGHGAATLEIATVRGPITVQTGASTHVAVTEPGVQRVTYEALRDGGLDLAGVPASSIAVTFRGEPVARWIDASAQKGGQFGPGSAVEFVGRPPAGKDALYTDASLYQVSIDRSLVRDAGKIGQGRAKTTSPSYLKETVVDRQALYHQQSPTGDPWVERSVLVRGGAPTIVRLDLPVEGPVLSGSSRLSIGLGTITNLPDLRDASGRTIPEHEVEVWLRGADGALHHVTSAATSGQKDWRIDATLPDGWLQPGLNQVELRFSTRYFYSLVVIDRYGVSHPHPYRGPALDFAPDKWSSGYRITGFSTPTAVVYAEGADGSLTRVDARGFTDAGGYGLEVRELDAARVWATEAPHTPAVFTTEAPSDLFSEPGDLVILAGSSFVGSRALDDYVAQRAAFDPVVIDVEDVYNAVGYGMPLPSALTDYLAARDAIHPFTHVQLVGTDCYDRLNLASSCLSFVPLPTAAVGVNVYTPSQNRLVDLTGDGVGDKAVGQFSVRDEAELATIVAKGAAWEASGLSGAESALLIAEESDGLHDFAGQIDRMRNRLGWSETDVLRMADHPNVLTARDVVRSSLDAGRAVTVFSGHSSPSVWAFRALLTAAEAATLTNDGRPTIMVPLACETTYDISPSANVLGHQLLYGGEHGALAISGAVALSSLHDNERMAGYVLAGLKAGLTLGEAVLEGRRALGTSNPELQDNWITQGDVAVGLRP